MYAMDAVSHRVIPEISRGLSGGSDHDDATQKKQLLRSVAFRISCLLVLVLRNTSASATPVDLTYGASRTAISRLVTERDCLTPGRHPRFVCGAPATSRR
jgi:hypothetical protein